MPALILDGAAVARLGAPMRLLAVLSLLLALVTPARAFDASDLRYTKPDGTVSTDPTQVYGAMPTMIGAGKGLNALYASIWNDAAPGQVAFPTAVTGHAENHSPGGTAFAGYFEAQAFVPGVVTTEIDAFNKAGVDAPAAYPWSRAFGIPTPLPIAITCGAGGANRSGACMEIVREGSTRGQFQHGLVFQKDAAVVSGITMDADASVGPRNNLVLRNTGQGGAVPILIQTMGPTNAAPTIQHQDATGATTWALGNDGAAEFQNYLSVSHPANPDIRWRNAGAPRDAGNWSAWTSQDGAWHLRAVNDPYTADANALTIRRAGMTPTVAEFAVPVRLPVTTVASLPSCASGLTGAMIAVSDALAPTYRGPLVGGGAERVPAFCDGSRWTAH